MLSLAILSLLAASTVVALPGGDKPYQVTSYYGGGYGDYTTCATKLFTTTSVGKITTVEATTKTIYVPTTKSTDVASTIVKDIVSTETKYETVTKVSTYLGQSTKVIPITTYTTIIETGIPYATTKTETIPKAHVTTIHSSYVTKVPTSYVETVPSSSVCSTTITKPCTSTVVATKTDCYTKKYGGY